MRACDIIPPVPKYIDPEDPRVTAHKMPAAMATETLLDIVTTADLLQDAILMDSPIEQQQKLIETARAQFESYLDLMAQAARHARALKP